MRVVVTGSSGFVGQHLVRALLERGHEVLGVDKRVPEIAPQFRFEQCDILDEERFLPAVRRFQPDAIAHLAARTDIEEKLDLSGYDANMRGVENVVRAVRETPSVRRAIYTSTQLVCRVGYRPSRDDDYMPNTLYGESKVVGEKIVRSQDGGGKPWCLVRPTTVWGPGMSEHYQRFFRMIQNGTYFHVGSKPLLKSLGFVGNVVHQYCRLLEVPAEQVHRRTLYVGDYEPTVLQNWADSLAMKIGAPRIPTVPESLARAAAHVGDCLNVVGWRRFPFNSLRLRNVLTEYTFDLSATREICGEVPYRLEEGAELTAEWVLRSTRRSR